STSAPLAYSVGRGTPAVTLTTRPIGPPSGTTVALRAAVKPAAPGAAKPTGRVTFKDGTKVLGTIDLAAAGMAEIVVTLSRGSHALAAYYSGDTNYLPWNTPQMFQTA